MEKTTTTYHHGNLRQALLEAAFVAAQQDGPKAIGLRKLARQVGVTSAAVYRHFPSQQALVVAVQGRILAELAGHMNEALKKVRSLEVPQATALEKVRAICWAYVDFALDEPELFRTSWTKDRTTPGFVPLTEREDEPLRILIEVLRELSATGYIAPGQEEAAAIALWATAHGLAELLLSGPLRGTSAKMRTTVVTQTIDSAIRGISRTS